MQVNMTVVIINIFAILGIGFSFYKNNLNSLRQVFDSSFIIYIIYKRS